MDFMNKEYYGVLIQKEPYGQWEGLPGVGQEYFDFCQNTAIPILKKDHPKWNFMIIKSVKYDNTIEWGH